MTAERPGSAADPGLSTAFPTLVDALRECVAAARSTSEDPFADAPAMCASARTATRVPPQKKDRYAPIPGTGEQPPRRTIGTWLGELTAVKVVALIVSAVGFIASIEQLFGQISAYLGIVITVGAVIVIVLGVVLYVKEWNQELRWPATFAVFVIVLGAMILASALTVQAPGIRNRDQNAGGRGSGPLFIENNNSLDLDPGNESSQPDITLSGYEQAFTVPRNSQAHIATVPQGKLSACDSATWNDATPGVRNGSYSVSAPIESGSSC
ncbi:hypothetical protein [Dactylosporangium sp. NPDC049140]|uniref:hypothetical protein n=1 Tax=Dactylosporangium sp. NPDC049140 TaxID=3155647 RepID=UPI0033CD63F8